MPEAQSTNSPDVIELVREKRALLASDDHWALLGVPEGAAPEAVRAAYFGLARVLHPDAVARQDLGDLKDAAAQVFKRIAEAYQVLSDRRRRAEYEARRAAGGSSSDPRMPRDTQSEARIFYHKGTLLMQRRSFGEAEACFRRAVELDKTTVKYQTALGWAVMQNTQLPVSNRMDEARRWFQAALEAAPTEPDAHYYMSLYWKSIGDAKNQRRELQECIDLNGRHVDAMREMRLLTMRTRKQGASAMFPAFQKLIEKFTGKKK